MEQMDHIKVALQFVHSGWARRRHSFPKPGRILGGISQPLCYFVERKCFTTLFTIAVDIRQDPSAKRCAAVFTLLAVSMTQAKEIDFIERQSPELRLCKPKVATGISPELAPVDDVDKGSADAASSAVPPGSAACVAFVHASVTA